MRRALCPRRRALPSRRAPPRKINDVESTEKFALWRGLNIVRARHGRGSLPGEWVWRGGRVVEGARLESVYAGNRIAGSNPAPSAIPLQSAARYPNPLFCRQGSYEGESGVDQLSTQCVIAEGRRPSSYPALHWSATGYHRGDAGYLQCPAGSILAEPDQHPVIAGAAEKITVQQPGSPAEHGLFRQSRLHSEIFP